MPDWFPGQVHDVLMRPFAKGTPGAGRSKAGMQFEYVIPDSIGAPPGAAGATNPLSHSSIAPISQAFAWHFRWRFRPWPPPLPPQALMRFRPQPAPPRR